MVTRLRILIVGGFPPQGTKIYGGIVSACKELLNSSFPDRFELILVDSTQQSVFPPPSFWIRGITGIKRLIKGFSLIKKEKPDVVIVFASLGMSIIEKSFYVFHAKSRGIPSLFFLRAGRFMDLCRTSNFYRHFFKLILSAPTFLVCQGKSWQDFYHRTLGFENERCPIIQNWTATEELLAIGNVRNYSSNRKHINLLFMGWLDDVKGVMHLLEAFQRLEKLPNIPELKLIFAGEGNLSIQARQWVRENQLNERVKFLGWIDGQEKLDTFKMADIFILPTYAEGLPNAMIEAMAVGLPVVVTPVGAIPDFITNGLEGTFVMPKDSESLYKVLSHIVQNVNLIEAMGRAARRTAEHQFGSMQAVDKLSALILKACKISDHTKQG